jgi:aspartyl protease family protein
MLTAQVDIFRRVDPSQTTMRTLRIATLLSALTAYVGAFGAQDIKVLMLSESKAIVRVGDDRRVLVVGETSPDGLKLLSIDGDHIVVDRNGEILHLALTNRIGQPSAPRSARSKKVHRMYADSDGMFRTKGSINGYPVDFLLDTGATVIALSARQARRIGVEFRLDGMPTTAVTASGVAKAYEIKLHSVKVGEIELHHVDAMVIAGDFPVEVLLGMSFLENLRMERDDHVVVLEK